MSADGLFRNMSPQWTTPDESQRVTDALPAGTRVRTEVAGVTREGTVTGRRYLKSGTHMIQVCDDAGMTRSVYPDDVREVIDTP